MNIEIATEAHPQLGTRCWEWVGASLPQGYGKISINGDYHYAHRYSWELYRGEIPELVDNEHHGTCILHRCDNPSCVRPDHLMVGTMLDNIIDRDVKGRNGGCFDTLPSLESGKYDDRLTIDFEIDSG